MKSIVSIFALCLSLFSERAHAVSPTDGLPDNVKNEHLAMTYGEGCQDNVNDGPQSFAIDKDHTLYLVQCYNGAYQGTYRGYISDSAKPDANVTAVMTLTYSEIDHGVVATLNLIEATYDEKTHVLSTYAKGRGIGDCGQSSDTNVVMSPIGVVSVKTTRIQAKLACDGHWVDPSKWPTVFKQK